MKRSAAFVALVLVLAAAHWRRLLTSGSPTLSPAEKQALRDAPNDQDAPKIDLQKLGLDAAADSVPVAAPAAAAPAEAPVDKEEQEADVAAPLHILRSAINQERGGESFTFVQLSDSHIGRGTFDYGEPGYDDRMPPGDIGGPAKSLRAAVNWINANKDAEHIKFVVVTGDMTNSAEKSEFLKAREILDALTVPYVPVLGNHDAWPYAKASKTEYTQSPFPDGDRYFSEVFAPTFKTLAATFPEWDDGTRLTPIGGQGNGDFESYLQNFAFSYRGYRFVYLDFNPRTPASFDINPMAPVHRNPPGIGGEAAPHAATVSYMKSQIEGGSGRHVLLFAHHPLSKFPPDFIKMSFTFKGYDRMAHMVRDDDNGSVDAWIAGHLHRNAEYNIKTLGMRKTGCQGIETGPTFKGDLRLITVWGAAPEATASR